MQPDYIVGSDITYDEGQYLPLLQTIAAYAWGNTHLKVRQDASCDQGHADHTHDVYVHRSWKRETVTMFRLGILCLL